MAPVREDGIANAYYFYKAFLIPVSSDTRWELQGSSRDVRRLEFDMKRYSVCDPYGRYEEDAHIYITT